MTSSGSLLLRSTSTLAFRGSVGSGQAGGLHRELRRQVWVQRLWAAAELQQQPRERADGALKLKCDDAVVATPRCV